MIFAVFFMLLFFVVSIIWECYNINQKKHILIINFFGLMYGLTYGLLPALVIICFYSLNLDISHYYYGIDYSDSGLYRIIIWFICAVVGYFFIQLFYYRLPFFKQSENYFFQTHMLTNEIFLKKFQMLLIYCIPIAIISMYLWTKAYGGIFNLIMIASAVRDNAADIDNPIAFFMRPAKLILATTYMSLFLIKKGYNVYLNSVFFVISFIASILLLLALDGRLGMATFIVAVVMIAVGFFERDAISKKKICFLCIIASLALLLIVKMDDITFFLRTSTWNASSSSHIPFYEKILSEFTYIITGAQKIVELYENDNLPYLIWDDLKTGIFAWLPSSLKPNDLINIWNYNTLLCTTTRMIYGQLPCDFITTSLYDFGLGGPIIFALFWGKIMKFFDKLYMKSHDMMYDVAYVILILSFIRRVNYCLLYDFILGSFFICFAYAIWIISKKNFV